MKTIIHENERGLLFRNGRFRKMLEPGKYHSLFGKDIEILNMSKPLTPAGCSLETLLRNRQLASQVATAEVGDQSLGMHFVDGKFSGVLLPGKYAFWSVLQKHTFTIVSTAAPEASQEVPQYIWNKIPGYLFTKVEVAPYQKARLYFDKKLVRLLDEGTYYFWRGATQVDFDLIDTRMTRLEITGQEILTQDKVTLRINFVCNYKITDFVKVLTEIDNYQEQIHVAAQLALREYVGKYRVDEILENKEQLSSAVFETLREKAKALHIAVIDAGVKDIILPGEIRDIMNTVLVAEKRAQANVISRREEVASTRSLLNTAKLMEDNQTLYKLKELEYLERICENVGSITLNGSSDILSQLTTILRSRTVS